MSRPRPARVLGLLLVVALVFSGFVANADAKGLSKAKKQAISKKLMRAVKKNPRVVSKRWFLKQASVVNWTLPATIRLLPAKDKNGTRVNNAQTTVSTASALNDTFIAVNDTTGFTVGSVVFIGLNTANEQARTIVAPAPPASGTGTLNLSGPIAVHGIGEGVSTLPNGANKATLDLGPSLGARTIGLGGFIKANINFNDAFNGGNLGDVKLSFPSGGNITTTSVGLLANPNVNDAGDANTYRAPENSLYSTVVDTGNANVFTFKFATGSETVGVPANDPALANSIESAIATLTNPVQGTGTVGSQGVYVNVTPTGTPTPTSAKVTIEFGGPTFNGVDVTGLINGPGSTGTTYVPLNEDVHGDNGSLDLDGQGGCASFDGNGSTTFGPAASDVDKLGNISSSNNPGGVNNLGPGPSFGGSGDPADTVLRTGPLSVKIADTRGQGALGGWSANDGIPADSSEKGIGGSTGIVQPAIGASGGKANLFGSPVNGLGSGHAVDVTVNLTTDINSIEREVDGGFPAPNGKPNETGGNVNAYANCRQAWSGAITDYLTNIHLVGNLKISPAITADGKLRIARAYLKSQAPAEEALAACLSPYQLFLRGNEYTNDAFAPFSSVPHALGVASGVGPNLYASNTSGADVNGFNPLAVLLGSGLPATGPSPSAAPAARCDQGAGPLDRTPFGVSPLAGTSGSATAPGLPAMLTQGAAVAVRGELSVTNLNAEVLVGNVPLG